LRPDSLAELCPNGAVRGIVVVNSTRFHLYQPSHFLVVPGVLQVLDSKYFGGPANPG
jgi:hypothetical protein